MLANTDASIKHEDDRHVIDIILALLDDPLLVQHGASTRQNFIFLSDILQESKKNR